MRVPAIIYADENLIRDMDDKVYEQAANVAKLPGIVQASYAMPDAHWGYGFPIGGVAAFDPDEGGVVSAGGVGFDISCGVRTMLTGPDGRGHSACPEVARRLCCSARSRPASAARARSRSIPSRWMPCWRAAPIGRSSAAGARRATSSGSRREAGWRAPSPRAFPSAPRNGSGGRWARSGLATIILRCRPSRKSSMQASPRFLGCQQDDVVVTIHCGSRGLGHQIGTEFLQGNGRDGESIGHRASRPRARLCADQLGGRPALPGRDAGGDQLRARQPRNPRPLRAARLSVTFFPGSDLRLLFDVSHNTCKVEPHVVDGKRRELVRPSQRRNPRLRTRSRKPARGAASVGQPVLIGGSMGTGSYILVGETERRAEGVFVGLPRRRPGTLPPCRAQAMERAQDRG